MSSTEKKFGIIHDIVFPKDINTRYDLYFTDKRVAIVCLGRSNRYESHEDVSVVSSAFGVPPPLQFDGGAEKQKGTIDEEIKGWALDDLLRLSKKSGYYTYEEIQKFRLILGRKSKFEILSADCESKFVPDSDQVIQLIELLTSVEGLKNKFMIAGKWDLLKEVFQAHPKS